MPSSKLRERLLTLYILPYHLGFIPANAANKLAAARLATVHLLATSQAVADHIKRPAEKAFFNHINENLPKHNIYRLSGRFHHTFCLIGQIFCICDDFCREFDADAAKNALEAPKYRGCGKRKPAISDSEVITILTVFHTNTFRNFKHYYIHFVLTHLKDLFPNAPSYSRFVTLMKRVGVKMTCFLKLCLVGECTGISFVDSTCIPVCHDRRKSRNKVFEGLAESSKGTMGWFFGFKLHLLCNEKGEILNFMLTKGNVDDRDPMIFKQFSKDLFGKLYADRGYIGSKLFDLLWSNDVHIVTGVRDNMKNRLMSVMDKILLRKRHIIETINNMLKNVCQIVHTRHRSFDSFLINMLAALSAYCFFDKKSAINVGFSMVEEKNAQLAVWT